MRTGLRRTILREEAIILIDPNALYDMLTHGPFSSGWFDSWFDAVQEEERFAAQLERVKTYMENYRR